MKNKEIRLNILCGINKITNNCYYKVIRVYVPLVKNSEDILVEQELENKKLLNHIIEHGNPIKLLDSEIYFDDYKEIINSHCKDIMQLGQCELYPNKCRNYAENLIKNIRILDNEVKFCIGRRNQYKRTLEQLKLLVSGSKNKSNIFVKFGLDKCNELICTVLDYNAIFSNNIYKSLELYVIYGRKELNGRYDRKNTFMHIYFHNGSNELEIVDFFCSDYKIRCGHGSFALKSLSEAAVLINKKIKEIKDRSVDNFHKHEIGLIEKIYGDIVPGRDLTYDDLVRFYKKNGYLTEGKLSKYFE